jgi:hypothetical protein
MWNCDFVLADCSVFRRDTANGLSSPTRRAEGDEGLSFPTGKQPPNTIFPPTAKKNQPWFPNLSAVPLKPTVLSFFPQRRKKKDGSSNYISVLIPILVSA